MKFSDIKPLNVLVIVLIIFFSIALGLFRSNLRYELRTYDKITIGRVYHINGLNTRFFYEYIDSLTYKKHRFVQDIPSNFKMELNEHLLIQYSSKNAGNHKVIFEKFEERSSKKPYYNK